MKKALVVAIVMVLGLGALAFAGPLSGEWETTIGINPGASVMTDFFDTLSSTLTIDYVLGGWTFGAVSGFGLTGFSSQSFTAGGVLGAFTFASTMTFAPAAVTTKTYTTFWAEKTSLTQAPTTTICPITYVATTEPKFLKWTATGSVSIAGVDFEGMFILDQSHYNVDLVDYVTTIGDNPVQTDAVTATSYKNGSGWRFKIAGSFGDVALTSYTYFNLNELGVKTTYCPAVGKRGVFSIATESCTPGFTEEYITAEGFSIGCATLDVGLSILCSGFNSLEFVINDIAIGGWVDLDFAVTFTTTSKTLDWCMSLEGFAVDCVTLEIGLGSNTYVTDTTIGDITLHGISFSTTWGGITFTSSTELDAYSALMSGSTTWSYLYADTTNSYLVPFVGVKSVVAGSAAGNCGTPAAVDACTTYFTLADEYYELKCVPTERYKLWEEFVIESDADSCCGGALGITLTTKFGDNEVLSWYGYGTYAAGSTSATTHELYDKDGDVTYAFAARTTTTRDAVSTHVAYEAGSTTTLFGWAETDAELSVGVGSNITLTLGFDISAFGWEGLDFGFDFTF